METSFWTYLDDTKVKAPPGLDGQNLVYVILAFILFVTFIRIHFYTISYSIGKKENIRKAKDGIKYIFIIMVLAFGGYKILGIVKGLFELILAKG